MKKDGTIERATFTRVADKSGEVLGRFFDAREAVCLCKCYGLNVAESCNQESGEIIWLYGAARLLGPEIQSGKMETLVPKSGEREKNETRRIGRKNQTTQTS